MFWRSIGVKLVALIVIFSLLCTGFFALLLDRELRRHYNRDIAVISEDAGSHVAAELDLSALDRRMDILRAKIFAFTILFVLGLAAVASLFVYEIVYKPLREVIRGTKAISAGNLDAAIVADTKKDEIGYLARSFNTMAARVKEMNADLSRLNEELEQKVEERTDELKKTQANVLQSEKLASLGLMAAAIAHEINNPLTAVLTYSSLLMKSADEGSELKEDLAVVVSETTRCRGIVRGLLDFARGSEMHQRSMNINDLLTRTISLISGQVTFHDIRIVRDFAKFMPQVVMDEDQIKQLFVNIMLNAADAMPNGGTLKIRTSFDYEENEVMIEFKDSGAGISEHDMGRIFDPFFTTKEKGKGTGLGLSVVYGIVQRHSGIINVKSAPGKGTSFILTFPVV